MGKVTLSLSDESEEKLRSLAERDRRTLAGTVEYALEVLDEK